MLNRSNIYIYTGIYTYISVWAEPPHRLEMIGSPDLLAFTGTEGFGEGEEEAQGLPEEFSVPLLPPSHPWTTSAKFHRDFILVAEFSEQVGPKPVLTIPDDQRVIGSFDLNHFSVRIMSVDYQASGPAHVPPACPGPRLNFSEDSRVILGDSGEDAFAYVHHMTLYDLEARGMVRPFCMAYVCSDQAKLMENYSELSTCFSQASDSLKTGNRQAFSMELQRKLQELEYTRLTLLQETEHSRTANGFTEVGEKADELEAVERSILNHRDLLRQVTSYPNRKLKQPDFLPYDPADSLADPSALLPPEPCPSLSTSASCRSEHRLKPLQELCNAYFLSLMKEQLADTERRLRGDRSILSTARVTRSLSKRLTLINFLFELWSPEDGDEEEKESAEAELQRATGSKSSGEMFQSEPMSLESFFSCVEEIPIKMEAGEAGTVTPDPNVATEMTGSVSSGDSIEVLGTEKSYRSQHDVAGSDSRETQVGMTDASYRRAAVEAGSRRVRAYARRANSEDSIEVLSTTESIFPDDLTAITEEETEHQPLSNGFENENEIQCESDNVLKEGETLNATMSVSEGVKGAPVQEGDGRADREESLKQMTASGEVIMREEQVTECLKSNQVPEDKPEKTSRLLKVEEAVESTPQWPAVCPTVQSVPDLHVNFAPPVAVAEVERWSPPCAPLRLLSIDEASDCASFTGSTDTPSPSLNIHSSTRLDKRRRRRKAGLRALRFLKQNSFSQHAVFCLLSGRPLVVIGGDESLVRKLVDALSLFLPAPGPDGNAVMACLTMPLQLADLLTWRLIGIHRSHSSSSAIILHSLTRYSRYLSLLDLDQRTLHCPPYSGSLISRLADPHTGITRGITYLLHLESCLTALANQVLLYTFNPAYQRPKTAGGKDTAEKDESLSTRGFCSSESDLKVMNFLSDLIKQHHAGRGPPVLRFSYCSAHLHKNTYAT
ncbi:guanine nucleotide exchange protein smcr8b isoform X2 [Dicentrarchus labrax]|uniref:Smith-Magenis syndrome chromosome region, candidate 8b n=1 Tax=Dicentrarchus labrax TaxID=13489 RepID=A0A8C4HD59_DICLA|nr:guanine nucleotide exchange protein smcr8b isoform X2 [Dicentrarchus labrax]